MTEDVAFQPLESKYLSFPFLETRRRTRSEPRVLKLLTQLRPPESCNVASLVWRTVDRVRAKDSNTAPP